MYTDYFLKAPSKEAFDAANPWGDVTESHNYVLDIVGVIVSCDAQFDVEGNLTVPPTVVPGWHVNLRLRNTMILPASLEPFVMPTPAFPKQRFA